MQDENLKSGVKFSHPIFMFNFVLTLYVKFGTIWYYNTLLIDDISKMVCIFTLANIEMLD